MSVLSGLTLGGLFSCTARPVVASAGFGGNKQKVILGAIHIYIYIHTHICIHLSLSLYIYIYTHREHIQHTSNTKQIKHTLHSSRTAHQRANNLFRRLHAHERLLLLVVVLVLSLLLLLLIITIIIMFIIIIMCSGPWSSSAPRRGTSYVVV